MPPRRRRSVRSSRRTEYAVLPVRDALLFPNQVSPLIIHRDLSLRAVERAIASESALLVLAQKDLAVAEVDPEDLYQIGPLAVGGRVLTMTDGATNALIQRQRRRRARE